METFEQYLIRTLEKYIQSRDFTPEEQKAIIDFVDFAEKSREDNGGN